MYINVVVIQLTFSSPFKITFVVDYNTNRRLRSAFNYFIVRLHMYDGTHSISVFPVNV